MEHVIGAAESANANVVVKITGDCPIIDSQIIEQLVRIFKAHDMACVSNAHIRSYPDGMDTKLFILESLRRSDAMTNEPLDREHVSLHTRNHPEIFPHVHIAVPPSLYWPHLGLTLVEQADDILLKNIIETLGPKIQYSLACM